MAAQVVSTGALRVQIASDLHLEFFRDGIDLEEILSPCAPVLALLGDISALGSARGRQVYEVFLEQCCGRFEQVLVLAGNHEYYCGSRENRASVRSIQAYMRSLGSSRFPNLMVLENDVVELVDGVRIAGCALWSHIPACQTISGAAEAGVDPWGTVERRLTDYRSIYVDREVEEGREPGLRTVTAEETTAWHTESVEFIRREAARATADGKSLLVLTHHTPSFHGTAAPEHGEDPEGFGSGFSTNLEHLLADPELAAIHTWCFGHTHYNSDQVAHGCRLVSNQRGYLIERCPGYEMDKVIEVHPKFDVVAAGGLDVDVVSADGGEGGQE
uniref:Calcineurin-like phosphoesterase domain-containing protein n=1 Tax=Rhizochromulina marina TaxID=1034831 RepID=A0A7S2SUR8_9STRA|mmetsp:Transcript_6713/g.19562  ORF Transcript_6713/g.19562 Transcript_6713/m.19562 type:complete len:330 (+) Transcript_6713:471-1460(+)